MKLNTISNEDCLEGKKQMQLDEIEFKEITKEETKEILLNYHYLQRMPPLSVAFGAFHSGRLVGVMTFGKPPSNSLCKGVAGESFSGNVYELNRLYTFEDTPKNLESKFISYALKKLKQRNWIVISYADESMGHSGYVYQATNWIYTGKSAKRTDVYVGENGHSRTYSNFQKDFVVRKVRSTKHRYLYICGDKNFKKEVLENLKYPIINEYPKGEVRHYEVGETTNDILYHKKTHEIFTEDEFIKNPSKYLSEDELNYYKKYYLPESEVLTLF